MTADVLVVGAGLAGSVSARALAEAGRSVLVMERLPHVAGHCHDYRNEHGISVHSHGPHIFHTSDRGVWDWVGRFTSFRQYRHRVLSFAEGRLFSFPINCDTINDVFGLTLGPSDVSPFLASEVSGARFADPPRNYRDAVVSQVGERLYELFFRNYTRKQWGRDPEELDASLARRIPVRTNRDDRYFTDPYQGIPECGYTAVVERILDHPSIEVMLDADFFDHMDAVSPRLTVYTGPLDRYFHGRFGKLEYRSLRLEFETLHRERFQPAAVVNYPNDHEWTRITEFKWFLDEVSDRTTVLYEYPAADGEPYYIVPTADNRARCERYMAEVAALERAGTHLFVGRLAEYTYYNMDQVIGAALTRTRKAIGGGA